MTGMLLRIVEIHPGWHPSECMVLVPDAGGEPQTVFVDQSSVEGDRLRVGFPVDQRPGEYLVELPRETMSGAWRVWVRRDDLAEAA